MRGFKRFWWPVLFFLLGAAIKVIDLIGEAQTVSDFPILKILVNPAFSTLLLFAGICGGSLVYYDLLLKKEPSGFAGVPGKNKKRYRNQAIAGAVVVILLLVVCPLVYRHYKSSKAVKEQPVAIFPPANSNPLPTNPKPTPALVKKKTHRAESHPAPTEPNACFGSEDNVNVTIENNSCSGTNPTMFVFKRNKNLTARGNTANITEPKQPK
jgi:hypothetical protein